MTPWGGILGEDLWAATWGCHGNPGLDPSQSAGRCAWPEQAMTGGSSGL